MHGHMNVKVRNTPVEMRTASPCLVGWLFVCLFDIFFLTIDPY